MLKVKCPTCNDEVIWQSTSLFRPFCSERCRLIDLGEWASGERVIAGASLLSSAVENMDEEDIEAFLTQLPQH